jgi:hypothetical protein
MATEQNAPERPLDKDLADKIIAHLPSTKYLDIQQTVHRALGGNAVAIYSLVKVFVGENGEKKYPRDNALAQRLAFEAANRGEVIDQNSPSGARRQPLNKDLADAIVACLSFGKYPGLKVIVNLAFGGDKNAISVLGEVFSGAYGDIYPRDMELASKLMFEAANRRDVRAYLYLTQRQSG